MTTYRIRGTLVVGAFDPFDTDVEPETKNIDQQIRAESPAAAVAAIARQSAWSSQPDLVSWLNPPRIDVIGA